MNYEVTRDTSSSQSSGAHSARFDESKAVRQQAEIRDLENRFNSNENEIKKLASVWLLATFGAIAVVIREEATAGELSNSLLVCAIATMGSFGLTVLWVLDQLVYHRLLASVFVLGLRLEHMFPQILPVRAVMMRGSSDRGMARYIRLYYLGPVLLLSGLASAIGASNLWTGGPTASSVNTAVATVGLAACLLPAWLIWQSLHIENFREIAASFGDSEFLELVEAGAYERIIRRSARFPIAGEKVSGPELPDA